MNIYIYKLYLCIPYTCLCHNSHYEITKEPSALSTDLLNMKIPTTLEKLLMDDIDEIKWISKKPVNDKICMRDYSKQCPSMWEPITETQCSAPK